MRDVSADELLEAARRVIAAEIAKIHTIEWAPQLLYGEPLYLGMNANWSGLFARHQLVGDALEFYTALGVDWVNDNGPNGRQLEAGRPNGHEMEVSPLKRVLLRTVPELGPELAQVVNAFDPWAREPGAYYSVDWKPRPGAETDPSFIK